MRIIIDIDDVLADTLTVLEMVLGPARDKTTEDLQNFFPDTDLSKILLDEAFNLDIPPVPGASTGVAILREQGHNIEYLSARSPTLAEVTQMWLDDYGFPPAIVKCEGRENKKQILNVEEYDLLVDDQLRYLNIAHTRGIQSIAFAYPWNQSWGGTRVSTWPDIIASIES